MSENLIKSINVIMREWTALRARQPNPAKNGIVRQAVMDNQVLRPQYMSNHADVGGVASHHGDCIFAAQELCNLMLQFRV